MVLINTFMQHLKQCIVNQNRHSWAELAHVMYTWLFDQ